jgi:hypothetical protein
MKLNWVKVSGRIVFGTGIIWIKKKQKHILHIPEFDLVARIGNKE